MLATLARDPSVDASAIGIVVCAGVVSLSGCVGTYTEKWMASHAIQQISGGVIAPAGEIHFDFGGPFARAATLPSLPYPCYSSRNFTVGSSATRALNARSQRR